MSAATSYILNFQTQKIVVFENFLTQNPLNTISKISTVNPLVKNSTEILWEKFQTFLTVHPLQKNHNSKLFGARLCVNTALDLNITLIPKTYFSSFPVRLVELFKNLFRNSKTQTDINI